MPSTSHDVFFDSPVIVYAPVARCRPPAYSGVVSVHPQTQVLDIDALRARLPELRSRFAEADPFPHVVLDDALLPEAFAEAAASFPDVKDPFWKGYLHLNETKYGNSYPDTWSGPLQDVARALTSPAFVEFLSDLSGIPDLLPDWTMDGGGLHQTLRGGYLNIHTDFSTHHLHENWARRVNVLLYLNTEWDEAWGGQLELWDQRMTGRVGSVQPQGNRMLIFATSDKSLHGHPDPLVCPDGQARRSMALYYFTEDEAAVRHSTGYRARPEDGMKKVAIWADTQAVDLYDRAKRRFGWSDDRTQVLLAKLHRLKRRGR